MKVTLPFLFVIIFWGCQSTGGKKINQETVYERESETELYPIDSTLFEIPCMKESLTAIEYRGEVRYMVKDMNAAEKKVKEIILAPYALEPQSRNENVSNGIIHKTYQYTIPTEDLLDVERALDSLLGRAESKHINKSAVNYEFLIGNLTEEQKTYKISVARYNNASVRFQEKNDLLTAIGNTAKNIKGMQQAVQASCENKSVLIIQLSAKL